MRARFLSVLVAATSAFAVVTSAGQKDSAGPRKVTSPRLYVFDCGTLTAADPARFRLKREEVATTNLSVACFLVDHPRGRLMWDPGIVPDADWTPTGGPVTHHLALPDGTTRDVIMRKRLAPQLAEVGYTVKDVEYLAFSHYHYDHTANANAFAGSTWLVRQVERDVMFAEKPPALVHLPYYGALRTSKTVIIKNDEHDVFGDGSVILKLASGHTPGHQVLYVKLAQTGSVVLSGDLYHFPESRALKRVTIFDFDQAQSIVTRDAVEAFLKKMGAQLWIQHDSIGNGRLKKAPDYYE
jgi:glyoxylase-like metal-dependent hydrolase (beta-lactamase superfamily II)